MAYWKTYKVWDVVSRIDDDEYVLPVIQRELVWNEEKMELLFDSLLKGNSFGGIIVIEEEKGSKPLFASRLFTRDGSTVYSQSNDESLSRTQCFVVDGQQRLQSFYIGLKGTYHGKALYFDLFSDYNNSFDFQFAESVNSLPTATKEERPVNACFWISVKELSSLLKDCGDGDYLAEKMIIDHGIDDNNKDHIRKNIRAFEKSVFTADVIGVAKVTVNKIQYTETENRQKIVELFKRLNDGGTRLSPIELVASTLKAFDWRMEGFLRRMEEDFSDIGLTSDNLIKLIFLLQDNYTKEMASIEASDAEFAIKKQVRIENTLKSVCNYLNLAGLQNYYKDSNRSFIPLFFVSYHIFHKAITDEEVVSYWDDYDTGNIDYKPLTNWMYYSLLNGVFRSKGAGWVPYKTGIKQILSVVKDYKNKAFPFDELEQVYINYPIKYLNSVSCENLSELDMPFVFYLIYDRRRQVRTNDVDHIMPKNVFQPVRDAA